MVAYLNMRLYKGIISNLTTGGGGTASDPVAEYIDLLTGNLILADEAGESGWDTGLPIIKNSGVWSDPVAIDGRQLIAGRTGNVRETMTLILNLPPGPPRAAALSKLMEFSRNAREFWQSDTPGTQVYLEVHWTNAPGPQYALLYDIEVSAGSNFYFDANPPKITITFEREPSWRTVPPGNAYLAGFWPAVSVTKADLKAYDERGTANVNYIDIPAASIPGDMPADIYLTYNQVSGAPTNPPTFLIARSTRKDRNPTSNSASGGGGNYNTGTPRMRNTLVGGDAAVTGAWAILADAANGLISNSTPATRYVARHNTALTAVNHYLRWRVIANQWPSRYAVFVRAKLVAGAIGNLTLSAGLTTVNGTNYFQQTPAVQLKSATYDTTFLGILDLTRAGSVVREADSTASTQSGLDIHLILNKAAAVAVDLRIVDVVLMPIDEPNALVTPIASAAALIWTNTGPIAVDSAGILAGPSRDFIARFNSPLNDGGAPFNYRGTKLQLLPNMINRLYLMPMLTSELVTGTYTITVNIYPRWAGMRSV